MSVMSHSFFFSALYKACKSSKQYPNSESIHSNTIITPTTSTTPKHHFHSTFSFCFSPHSTVCSVMGRNSQVCTSCIHNCRLFHRSSTTSPTSFYKFILRQNDFTFLYLPPKLNHAMSILVDKNITLKDSTGRRWFVTVSSVDGSFVFKEGWNVFSSDHNLAIGDMVVFNCINKLDFDVKIYDASVCEKFDFSRKRKRNNLGGTSTENISENGSVDRRVQSMCKFERIDDTCGITSHIYQNDAASFNKDPMFEEVLGTGDTSYASKLERFGRCNSVGETDKAAYDWTNALIVEENKEEKSILSNREVQESQFAEILEGDQMAIKEERFNEITSLVDAQIHTGEIMAVPIKMTPEIDSFNDKLHATELPGVIMGECNQDEKSHFETVATVSSVVLIDNNGLNSKQKFDDISDLLGDQVDIGETKQVHMDMTPNVCSLNDKLNVTGSPKVKEEFIEDETEATVTCVVLTDKNHLKLQNALPLCFKRFRMKRTVVLLKDPLGRLWPVLCIEKTWLTSGWVDFQRANDIKSGDVCVFRVENKYGDIVDVHIDHK